MSKLTNIDRAVNGKVVLDWYRNHLGSDDDQTAMSDLLSDLMHLCDLVQIDFDEVRERAERHYVAESTEKD